VSRDRFEPEDHPSRPLPPRLDPRAGRPARSRSADGGAAAPRQRTRRWGLVGRIVGGVLSLVLLATSGWGWYLGQVADASVNRTDAIPTSGNEDTSHTGADMNLLLVGQDGREDLTPEQLAELNAGANDSGGLNTDTMILVHVPADGSRASFVSFPRDSYVQIPGHGKDRLNAAYAYGYQSAGADADKSAKEAAGSQLLVQTISQLTGLQIDHYAEVDLLGFFNLATVVGGVEVNLCRAVDDRAYSGAFFPAGVQTISGADALKFVRQRHNIGNTSTDFDRIKRQQVFIAGVLRKLLSEDVLLDLGKQRQLVQAAAESLTVDQSLNLLQLAQQMQSVTAGNIEFQTVPNVGTADEDGKSIVKLADTGTLHAFFAQLSANPAPAAGDTTSASPAAPATVAPGKVTVDVFNGSGTPGLAGKTATALQTAGFVVGSTGNADASNYTKTEIRYATGAEALANTLLASVPGATLTPSTDAAKGTVQLVLGSDFNGVGQAVTATPATSAPATAGEDARTAADTSCIN
jgi:LCP family protein required for cell wall assembly